MYWYNMFAGLSNEVLINMKCIFQTEIDLTYSLLDQQFKLTNTVRNVSLDQNVMDSNHDGMDQQTAAQQSLLNLRKPNSAKITCRLDTEKGHY